MARSVVKVTLSVGDPEPGLWCPACNLPSVVAFKVTMLSESGVGRPIECARCADCGMGFPVECCR